MKVTRLRQCDEKPLYAQENHFSEQVFTRISSIENEIFEEPVTLSPTYAPVV